MLWLANELLVRWKLSVLTELDSESHGVQERVLATLLTEMDGIEQVRDVIVVAATNRKDLLDPALLRPGRMDTHLYIPPPDNAARFKILQIYTKRMPLDSSVDLKVLADQTELYTGADLENMCKEAALLALRENFHAPVVVALNSLDYI